MELCQVCRKVGDHLAPCEGKKERDGTVKPCPIAEYYKKRQEGK